MKRIARLACTSGHTVLELPFDAREQTDAWACWELGFYSHQVYGNVVKCPDCQAEDFILTVVDKA